MADTIRPESDEVEAVDLAELDAALTGGVDQVIADRVAPRELVPTERLVELGAEMPEVDFTQPRDEKPPRRPVVATARAWLREVDPRRIVGARVPLVVLPLMALLASWDDAALRVLLPEMRTDLGFDIAFLIRIASIVALVNNLLALPLGYMADRVRRVWMIRIGAVGANLASIVQGLAPGVAQLTAGRVVGAASSAVVEPASLPLLADYFPSTTRGRVVALVHMGRVAGAAIGPFVAGILGARYGWRAAVITLALVATGVSLLTFLLREPVRGGLDRREMGATDEEAAVEQSPVSWNEGVRAAFSIVTLRRISFSLPFTFAATAGLGALLPIYLSERFLVGPAQRGTLIAVLQLVPLIGLAFSGAIVDRLIATRPAGVVLVQASALLAQAAAVVVLAFAPTLTVAIAVLVPFVAIAAMLIPAERALNSLVVPARVRGLGVQIPQLFALLGIILLNAVAGYFDTLGIQRGMLLFVPLILIGALIVASAAPAVERDIRAAKAAAMAEQEAARARAAGRSKMLVCRDVDVTYDGVQVLFNVDFDVEEGEIVALLGTNGAGKSTLLRAIAGIQQASNGAIFLDGRDITAVPPHENAALGIVMMPGGNAVFPGLTVEQNLQAAATMYRADQSYVRERMEEVLELFPVLRDRLGQLAGTLSGGEQQQVGLGQAFLMQPRLLMIDELSLGLAPVVVEHLLATLRRIHAKGTTIVLVEQSLNVALTVAERAVFMDRGEIRFSGPTEELLARSELVRSVFMGRAGATGATARRSDARAATHGDATREPALRVAGLGVAFGGVHALRDVSLDVHPGEIVGIIGPNGAGKTTLFDAISGYVAPDSGRVELAGLDVTRARPDARARVGLSRSFQNARLFGSLTVREAIATAFERRAVKSPLLTMIGAPTVRRSEARIARRVDSLIERLGLERYADKFVGELSTGTRRAVDMACIVALEPKVLLLDEPSSGLAQAECEAMAPLLNQIVRETGCGLVVIEHDIPLVTAVSDRMVAMELGAVLVSGTPDEVQRDPRVLGSYLAATDEVVARSDASAGRAAAIAAALDRSVADVRPPGGRRRPTDPIPDTPAADPSRRHQEGVTTMAVRSGRRPTAAKLTHRDFAERFDLMSDNIQQVIKGKDEVVRLALIAMLADGHILFEDLPGTGKTMLARSIAQTINAIQTRIQCTPDLLPADVTGSPVLDRKTGDFIFRRGPVFANVFLADEVNRATPKTQSSLLEAMAERRVTVDGTTHPLPTPFFTLATMNPIELAGTFPLPEAQLDRFMFKLSLGYAARDSQVEVLRANAQTHAISRLEPVIDIEDVVDMMVWARRVTVSDAMLYYIVDLCEATRTDPALQMGASSRAAEALLSASRVAAASQGRDDVLPDDIRPLVKPVIAHRLLLTPDALLREESLDGIVDRLLTRVKVPSGVPSARRREPVAAGA